ncbi:MAG TPA: hypothetical protein VEC57_00990 [Candidatus Limnocylindrales bacterium]|nr:hypothetical protein [Candidatus Limnocylindrales bacterium]
MAVPSRGRGGRLETTEGAAGGPVPAAVEVAPVPSADLPAVAPAAVPDEQGIPPAVTREKMNTLAAELRRIASAHGPDSVILQTKLMMRSIAAGAVGPTEVRVAGPSARLGPEYLEIDVDTGIIFAEPETTQNGRTDMIWRQVAGPVLEEMVSFNLEPHGLELVFLFGVQQTNEDPDPAKPSRFERFSIWLPADKLESAATENHTADAIRGAAVFGHLSAVEGRDH